MCCLGGTMAVAARSLDNSKPPKKIASLIWRIIIFKPPLRPFLDVSSAQRHILDQLFEVTILE